MSELPDRLPRHVAVIMDGNGRWANRRSLPRVEGHKAGAETVRTVARCCVEFSIPFLTLYAFSTENWRRPRAEVGYLMRQLRRFLVERREEMISEGIRLRAVGAVDELPAGVRRELAATAEATRDCGRLVVALALNYGGRREIAEAARAVAREVRDGLLDAESVDEDVLARHLYTVGMPDPDLMIRTAGEMRLSNFLLWQSSYTEFYVTETTWPDFDREEFIRALHAFAARERRYGGRTARRQER